MVQELIKGMLAGLLAALGLTVLTFQVIAPVQLVGGKESGGTDRDPGAIVQDEGVPILMPEDTGQPDVSDPVSVSPPMADTNPHDPLATPIASDGPALSVATPAGPPAVTGIDLAREAPDADRAPAVPDAPGTAELGQTPEFDAAAVQAESAPARLPRSESPVATVPGGRIASPAAPDIASRQASGPQRQNGAFAMPASGSSADAVAIDAATETTDPGPGVEPNAFGNLIERRRSATDAAGDDSFGTRDPAAADPIPDAPAFIRNAVPFDAADDQPVLSIILIDANGPPVSLNAPISVALSANRPGALERAAQYRDSGYEVLLMPDIPTNSTPQDIEQILQIALRTVDGAVAVLFLHSGDQRADRPALETLVGRLAESGHGLVGISDGLSPTRRLATQAGLPVGTLFSQIDDGDAGPPDMRRALDQAAFEARQNGAAIVVAHNRDTTRDALRDWIADDSARGVTLAPVSAAIKVQSQ